MITTKPQPLGLLIDRYLLKPYSLYTLCGRGALGVMSFICRTAISNYPYLIGHKRVPPPPMHQSHPEGLPGATAELVECGPRMREIGSSVPGQVIPMTYRIDT